jgi:hypothetical protein
MLELKERIKLNAEYLKYKKLTGHKNATDAQFDKFVELRDQLFTKTQYGWYKVNDSYIGNIRLYHIAYSLAKGREYEQVENKVREGNELTESQWKSINKIKESVYEENVHTSTT